MPHRLRNSMGCKGCAAYRMQARHCTAVQRSVGQPCDTTLLRRGRGTAAHQPLWWPTAERPRCNDRNILINANAAPEECEEALLEDVAVDLKCQELPHTSMHGGIPRDIEWSTACTTDGPLAPGPARRPKWTHARTPRPTASSRRRKTRPPRAARLSRMPSTRSARPVPEPSPGADVAGVSPVPVQMWEGRAQSPVQMRQMSSTRSARKSQATWECRFAARNMRAHKCSRHTRTRVRTR